MAAGAASRPASILFTDIAGFSTRMAARPQAEVVANLDCYFQMLGRCVHRHNGFAKHLEPPVG